MSETFIGLIKADSVDVFPLAIDGSLESYQKLVKGYLETVPTFDRDMLLLINEEGKLKRLGVNQLATYLSPYRQYDLLVGDAVLVRLNARRDDWTGFDSAYDVRSAVLHLLKLAEG